MQLDPVLAEIRQVREAYAEKFKGDIKAMLADIRVRQQREGRQTVALPARRSRESVGTPVQQADEVTSRT